MTQPWTPPTGNTWVDVTLQKRIGNPVGALTFEQNDLNASDTENPINWLGNKVMELLNNSWQTGEMKLSFNPTVPTGWLLINNTTIGSSASNSTYIGEQYLNLYTVLWASAVDTDLLTSAGGATTKGASASSDWGAGKRLYLPDLAGRAICGAGNSRSSITNRSLNARYGSESVNYTPSGTVSQASVSGITATCGAISTSGITATVSQATATSSSIDISSLTATSSSISIDSLTATSSAIDISGLGVNVTLNNGPLIGNSSLITVNGVSCRLYSTTEGDAEAIECTYLNVNVDDIAANLTTNVSVTTQEITGSIPTPNIVIGGTIPTPTITIGGAIPTPTITVGEQTVSIGGSIATPSITIGGSIDTQTFTGASATISTLSPSTAMYVFIKI